MKLDPENGRELTIAGGCLVLIVAFFFLMSC